MWPDPLALTPSSHHSPVYREVDLVPLTERLGPCALLERSMCQHCSFSPAALIQPNHSPFFLVGAGNSAKGWQLRVCNARWSCPTHWSGSGLKKAKESLCDLLFFSLTLPSPQRATRDLIILRSSTPDWWLWDAEILLRDWHFSLAVIPQILQYL